MTAGPWEDTADGLTQDRIEDIVAGWEQARFVNIVVGLVEVPERIAVAPGADRHVQELRHPADRKGPGLG